VRLIGFLLATVIYALVGAFVYLGILMKCGLGPGSSAACDITADRQGTAFLVGAIIFYAVLAFGYWRRWPKLKG
jgi:hypothetical protein